MGTRIGAHPAKMENSSGHWVAVGTQDPVLPPYELAAERCLRNLRCHAGSFDVVNAASSPSIVSRPRLRLQCKNRPAE